MTTVIYQLPQAFGLPVSVSPYCAKLELYFRLTERPYRTAAGDMRKSPTSKVPYVKWPDGSIQADSIDIIARLEREGPSLDEGLDADTRALGDSLQRELERKVYYAGLYARFVDPEGWKHQKAVLSDMLPRLIRRVLMPVIRKSITKDCARNGFPDDRGYPAAIEAIDRIAEQLGDNPYLLGDQPRVADCMAWATLLQTAHTRSNNPGRAAVRKHDNIMAYLDRLASDVGLTLPPLKP